MIVLRNIHKSFETTSRTVPVLKGIELEIRRGEYLAVTGASGSGKSTLLSVLGCLDRPSSGHYLFEGHDLSDWDDQRLARLRNQRIGFVFQAFNLIPALTIEENVEIPLFYAGIPRAQRRPLAEGALRRVGLGERIGHRPVQLSGGEQQRVAIARALILKPRIILADEPTGNLDSRTGQKILTLFDHLHARGATVLLVTHDPRIAQHVPRRIHLNDGVIVRDERRVPRPCGVR